MNHELNFKLLILLWAVFDFEHLSQVINVQWEILIFNRVLFLLYYVKVINFLKKEFLALEKYLKNFKWTIIQCYVNIFMECLHIKVQETEKLLL